MNINDLMKVAISEDDIRLIYPNALILTYNNLSDYNDIMELFNNNNYCFLLYETKKNFGHWTVIIKHDDSYEFFDSYGFKPDSELKFSPPYFRLCNNMIYPKLTLLLYNSNCNIEYNNKQLQAYKNNIFTCGRWCLFRCLKSNISIDDFIKFFNNVKNPDEYITLETYEILNK
jgi:hypothetical protein